MSLSSTWHERLSPVRKSGWADGPSRCSGLEVVRYSPDGMHAEFGASVRLLDSMREDHSTPSGVMQAFVYCLCRSRTKGTGRLGVSLHPPSRRNRARASTT
jgi:hypothetical protein